ncbi:MAG: radical SAM protein [Planctomycetota bacterium]
MAQTHKSLDTEEKLRLLSTDSQYDLACACGNTAADRRRRSAGNTWIYPVSLPDRGTTFLFKTLVSNACANDCKYCPLRAGRDIRRCSLGVEETADAFLDYHRTGRVSGLFLSSGVIGTADATMTRLTDIARRVRRQGFRGHLHLKVIPGASDAAVEEALRLASMVSVNIETPGAQHFKRLGGAKDYLEDIIRPLKLVSRLTGKGMRYEGVRQTTQFVVGASDETDQEIIRYMGGLYDRLRLARIYFSAYQRGAGAPDLPGERAAVSSANMLTREHRLYQADFLMRKYQFRGEEIPVAAGGNLALDEDPKTGFARLHPELYPVDVNTADRLTLLRVPGFGPQTVKRIIDLRRQGERITGLADIGRPCRRLIGAAPFISFDGRPAVADEGGLFE